MIESLVAFMLIVALVGLLAYLLVKHVKMLEPFRDVIGGGCAILLVLWLMLLLFGKAAWPKLPTIG
jgi:hypothetical protein